jgi:hypothetical protein
MKQKVIIWVILPLIVTALSSGYTNSYAQDQISTFRAVLQEWKGKEISFNDGTPVCMLTDLHEEYFECRANKLTKYYVAYHAISMIEVRGGKNASLRIYLMIQVK